MLSTSNCCRPARVLVVDPSVIVDEPRVALLVDTAPLVTVKLLVSNDAIPLAVVVASLIATSPLVTVKYVAAKLAIPLLLAVASSPATVIVEPECVTSTPSPPNILKL